jgi:hypothetical protein
MMWFGLLSPINLYVMRFADHALRGLRPFRMAILNRDPYFNNSMYKNTLLIIVLI